MPSLATYLPRMRRYLLEYPKVQLPDATSFLYWQETEFGLKRTIRINHLTIHEANDRTVVANRSRSDGLSGFTGLFVRRRVRSEVVNGVQAALVATKNRLERPR